MWLRNDGSQGKSGPGQGKQAGIKPGKIIMKQKFRWLKLEDAFLKNWNYRIWNKKNKLKYTAEKIEFNDIRKKGLIGNIDKKRTILTAIKRNAIKGKAEIAPIHNDDLRFKTWNDVEKPESKAVVLAMMDTSGSMGNFEKYDGKKFLFLDDEFLRYEI